MIIKKSLTKKQQYKMAKKGGKRKPKKKGY